MNNAKSATLRKPVRLFAVVFVVLMTFLISLTTSFTSAQTAAPPKPKQDKAETQKQEKQDADQDKKTSPKEDNKSKADNPQQDDSKKDEAKSKADAKAKVDAKAEADAKAKQEAQAKQEKEAKEKAAAKKAAEREKARQARRRKRRRYNKQNPYTLELFEPVIAKVRQSTVSVLRDKRRISYGVIVDPTGLILTKSSELRKPLRCRLPDNRIVDAKIYGIDPETDLALIKIEEQMLPFVQFEPQPGSAQVGTWVAAPGTTEQPVAFGIISVADRKIPASGGFMGILLGDHPQGVLVTGVNKNQPADIAGIEKDDVLVKVNGIKTPNRMKLVEVVSGKQPGEKITATVLRNGKEIDIDIILGNRDELDTTNQRSVNQNTMSGTISKRRNNFPIAFRHDAVLARNECGGPLVDLDGNVIGINIARGGRVESLALPNSVVLRVIEKLKSGSYLPAVVNKSKIEIIKSQLAEISESSTDLSIQKAEANAQFDKEEALEEEFKTILENLQKRLDKASKAKAEAKEKLDDLKKKVIQSKRNKSKLESELEKLTSGIN